MKKSIDGRNLPELCTCQKCPRGIWLYICRDRTIGTVSVVHVGGEAYEWRIYRVKKKKKKSIITHSDILYKRINKKV